MSQDQVSDMTTNSPDTNSELPQSRPVAPDSLDDLLYAAELETHGDVQKLSAAIRLHYRQRVLAAQESFVTDVHPQSKQRSVQAVSLEALLGIFGDAE